MKPLNLYNVTVKLKNDVVSNSTRYKTEIILYSDVLAGSLDEAKKIALSNIPKELKSNVVPKSILGEKVLDGKINNQLIALFK